MAVKNKKVSNNNGRKGIFKTNKNWWFIQTYYCGCETVSLNLGKNSTSKLFQLQSSADFTRITLLFPRLRLAWAFTAERGSHILWETASRLRKCTHNNTTHKTIYTITRYFLHIVNRINLPNAHSLWLHFPIYYFYFFTTPSSNSNN